MRPKHLRIRNDKGRGGGKVWKQERKKGWVMAVLYRRDPQKYQKGKDTVYYLKNRFSISNLPTSTWVQETSLFLTLFLLNPTSSLCACLWYFFSLIKIRARFYYTISKREDFAFVFGLHSRCNFPKQTLEKSMKVKLFKIFHKYLDPFPKDCTAL